MVQVPSSSNCPSRSQTWLVLQQEPLVRQEPVRGEQLPGEGRSNCGEAGVNTRRVNAAARQNSSGRVAKHGAATANSMQQQCAASASSSGGLTGRRGQRKVCSGTGSRCSRCRCRARPRTQTCCFARTAQRVGQEGAGVEGRVQACTPMCSISSQSLLACTLCVCKRWLAILQAPRDSWCNPGGAGHAYGHLGAPQRRCQRRRWPCPSDR